MDFLKVLTVVLFGLGIIKTASLSTSVSENGNFTIPTATTNWISSCNGRKRALVNVHWDTLSLDGDIPIPENGARVWIGYYRKYQYFSVKGCASAGSGGTHIGKVDNPLGHCFSLCKSLCHIGLEGSMCHCLSDDAFNALPINNATCSYETCGSGLVCGNNKTMWIYGVEKTNFSEISTAHDSVEKKCVSLTKNSVGAKWDAEKCNNGHRALCMKNDATVDSKEAAVVRGVTWDDALKICHDKLENLANISHENYRSVILNQHILDFQTGWTSFVRDLVVGTGGFDEKLTDLVDCAVIYKSEGKIKLDYQECSNMFPAVCLNEVQSTSTVTSTTTSTTNMTTTGTTQAPTTTGSTKPSTSISTNLQTASTTKVTNTRTIKPTTSTMHAVAAGNISSDTSAASSIEFGIITTTATTSADTTSPTTTSSTQSATGNSSATESITPKITISPSTSTVTAPTTFTIPVATTVGPMTKGSAKSTTSISLGQPKTNTTTIFNWSTTQPTTSTSLTSTTNSIPTWALASNSTRVGTATVSIPQGASNSSSTAVIPMAGRIGLGICAIVVVAGAVVVIKRMTAKRKRRHSTQTSAHSHDNKTELPKGIPMLGINEKEVSSNDDENEIKMKGTSNGCSKEGNVASDPNYECIQIESNIKHSNGPVGNSTGQINNEHSTNCQYATVVKVGKGSPKITKPTPESDTNTYDTTYVHQEKNRDTGDEYQHIYDHANSKNPTS